MADEAILRERFSDPINMTVADGAGIEKGTVMKLSTDPRTVLASAAKDVFGGILAREKIASDGRTQVACYFDGIFDMTVAPGATALVLGEIVALSGANFIQAASEADLIVGKAIGKVLETGSPSEIVQGKVGSIV